MKKVLFITTMILGSFILGAQHVELGLKAGLNVSAVHGPLLSNDYNYDPRISMHAGGLAHIHLNKKFAIQPEIVFSGQGFKAGNEVYRLNYLNLPVLGQYMFNSGFRLETGPQVGILLSGNSKKGNETPKDIRKNYKDVDLAWVFGAGYLMSCGLGFDARFNLGIPKINEINDDNFADRKSGIFQAGIFYQFKAMKHR